MWGLPSSTPAAHVATTDNPQLEPGDLVLKPAKIAHPDGSVETVYIQSDDAESTVENKNVLHALTSNLTTIYTLVGIIALTLAAYLSYRTIKNGQKK